MRLQNKVAIITGAGSGIGRAAALLIASEGARIVVGDCDEPAAENTVAEIRQAGGEAVASRTDVTRAKEVQTMVEKVVRTLGQIDILFNHAGVNKTGRVTELDEADWDLPAQSVVRSTRDSVLTAVPGLSTRRRRCP